MLPKIDLPIHTVQLISVDKPVRYRSFTVKEQKLLLMAVEAKDIDTTIKSVKQVITNCVIDPINVDELPLVDLETLFLHLRAKSLGEVLNLYFKCTNQVIVPPNPNSAMALSTTGAPYQEYKPCGMVIEVPVNLLEVPVINKDAPRKIMISKDVGLKMKYPTMEMIDNILTSNASNAVFAVVASCIESIFDKENVYNAKDATKEEMIGFVESLPIESFDVLDKFINNVPKNRFETKKKCPRCDYEHEFVLEGLSDFFS